ncbi:MAG: trypsin-like serine protease [Alphaproteobacteria bacterium]|nr:trypsin-like serine protease [Alphaproteobacteria bacterium]
MPRALIAACAALLLALPAAAQAPLPGVVGADDRHIVEPREYPWSAIGRLNTEIGQRCTGTLIGPRLVATAAHCLYNRRTGRPLRPESVHFLAGYARGAYVATARAVAIRRGADGPPGDAARDWALVTLEAPLGERVGWIGAAALNGPGIVAAARGAVVLRAGYGQDRPHLPMAVLGCHVLGAGAGGALVAHDCDAVRGDSGSPLLLLKDGELRLVAIHSGHRGRGETVAGIAVATAALRTAAGDPPASHPPARATGIDPVPTVTVRALAQRLRRPPPPPSLAALERLLRAP